MIHPAKPMGFLTLLFKHLAVAALYFLFGHFVHSTIPNSSEISVLWPGSGLALGVLLLGGPSYLWSVMLGSCLISLLSSHSTLATLGIATGNALEAWLGCWLLTRCMHFQRTLASLQDYLKLLAVAMIASLLGSIVAVTALMLSGNISPDDLLTDLINRWMGHVLGVVMVTSFILSWQDRSRLGKSPQETLLLLGATLLVGQVVFLDWFHDSFGKIARGYWEFLFVVWIAIRIGLRGVTTMGLVIAIQALLGALAGKGFFSNDIAMTGLHNYWFYMLIVSLVGVSLSIYIADLDLSLLNLKTAQQQESRAKEILDQMGKITKTGGWELLLPSRTLVWSDEIYRIHEVEPPFQPSLQTTVYFVLPDFRAKLNEALENAITQGTSFELELPFQTANQHRIWIRITCQTTMIDGKVVRLNGALQDITASKTMIDALKQANHDLENFSYSVSHDLRAPLRAIDGFIEILQEEQADNLNDNGKRMFGIVADNARKMGCLIDDILAYSRAGRLQLEILPVNMRDLVEEVWAGLLESVEGRQIELHLADIPAVPCDSRAIRQVWQNLLENAIKFTRDRDPAIITVSAAEEADCIRYRVTDNGVGFNVDFANKLFVLFQRLHGMDEFEGTGVGLAVVKRYIQKHGGEVMGFGIKDRGAEFSFTLPMQQNQAMS